MEVDEYCQQRNYKLTKLQLVVPTNEKWWNNVINATRIWGLIHTSFSFLYPALLVTFVDSWHGETSYFHIPGREIIVTLDDMHCLLHLPIDRRLLDHSGITCRADGIELMVTCLGASPADANHEVTITRAPMPGLHT
ncbi:hypothetical protein TSUD_162100 [Trifolium subterraneum]|uniref:Aminotransferase-like plant mobile domain-containing protein n=1 Tax=Trifolium subterraneum TaxID=3900 RepID=A0A2Z6NGT1_TRISU|nr:hypothetical protein TSUD_162100 [Trifolium subterraneum]